MGEKSSGKNSIKLEMENQCFHTFFMIFHLAFFTEKCEIMFKSFVSNFSLKKCRSLWFKFFTEKLKSLCFKFFTEKCKCLWFKFFTEKLKSWCFKIFTENPKGFFSTIFSRISVTCCRLLPTAHYGVRGDRVGVAIRQISAADL